MHRRVLMVDDQEWTIDKLQRVLREEGSQVDYASTLDAALSCLSKNQYDAVITDHDMDGLDGTQFTRTRCGNTVCDRCPSRGNCGVVRQCEVNQ